MLLLRAGEFFQGFLPGEQGLHDDEPTEHEPVTVFPEAGHPTKASHERGG